MKSKLIAVCFLMLFAVGCDKLKGEKGDKGDVGEKGEGTVIVSYEGTLGAGDFWVSVPTLTTRDLVTVLYSPTALLNSGEWLELGSPTGDNSLNHPYCAVDYYEKRVYMFNLDSCRYKIMVTKNWY